MLHKLIDRKGKKAIIVALLVALLGWAGINVSEQQVSQAVDLVINETERRVAPAPTEQVKESFEKASAITPQRRTHILYGDATGGGHLHGTGKPCKSEFPANWDESTIIKEVELIASNDNLDWEQQRNGYHVTEQKVGTVNVRVVKGRENKQVITAYPTNVPRNPCPANDR
ncbi:MAG: EndoU domain-containing protein [Alphaproteobacteria bacterium]|nr:EndoU domain-containing protein [Alphaproteobacteria bacterium]